MEEAFGEPLILPEHVVNRMAQRGVSSDEVRATLREGWFGGKPRPGTLAKVKVFLFRAFWEGKYYNEKEVTVYYKEAREGMIVSTVIAWFGSGFPEKDESA